MSERTPAILIVDDEEMVLSSLRGVFTLQTDYRILEANDPKRALETVSRTPVDLVISDFLMPKMNGIEFLKEVKRLQPESVRVLLTGYADKENAIRAINDVGLYHYLEKPWDNDALLNIVKNGLQEKGLRQMLAEKIRELDSLTTEHEALANRQRAMERELEMASRVQRSLLPKELPEIEGYRFDTFYQPCDAIGGDFFDVSTREAEVFLLVADVIGHGVRAALTTMLLKGVFQEASAGARGPAELLEDMNRRLFPIFPGSMYAAAACFHVSAGSPEITFSNAGLPYPFVLRREKRLDEIALSGQPLGLFAADLIPYETRTIETGPGDVVFAGSDGIGSISDGEAFFEDQALRRVLGELAGHDGETVIREAMKAALEFGGDRPLPDDVNLVAVTRR